MGLGCFGVVEGKGCVCRVLDFFPCGTNILCSHREVDDWVFFDVLELGEEEDLFN